MAVESARYAPLTADTSRGPSMAIWKDFPVASIAQDPSLGMHFFDDFLMFGDAVMSSIYKNSLGAWSSYAAAGSLISDGALEGGVISMTSGTDLDQTVMFSAAGAFRMLTTSTLALNPKLWFEARVAKSSVATDICECFVGLADKQLTSSIPAVNLLFSGVDDALATAPNLCGFYNKGDTAYTEWQFVYQLAAGTAVYSAGLTTLMNTALGAVFAANAFHKLGFLFDPAAQTAQVSSAGDLQTNGTLRKKLLRVFVDGVELPTFLTPDNMVATAAHAFPTGFMGPAFGCQQHATKGSFLMDWIRVGQLANT